MHHALRVAALHRAGLNVLATAGQWNSALLWSSFSEQRPGCQLRMPESHKAVEPLVAHNGSSKFSAASAIGWPALVLLLTCLVQLLPTPVSFWPGNEKPTQLANNSVPAAFLKVRQTILKPQKAALAATLTNGRAGN